MTTPSPESPETPVAAATRPLRVCPCGKYERSQATTIPEYSLWGWFLLSFGVSVVPKRLVFQCRCGRKFDAISDPAQLRKHT